MKIELGEVRSFLAAITFFAVTAWLIGKPHAEGFIEETVGGRISAIEKQLDDVQDQLEDQARVNEQLQRDSATLKSQGRNTAQGIEAVLDLLMEQAAE